MSFPDKLIIYDGVKYACNIGTMVRTNVIYDPSIGNLLVEPVDDVNVGFWLNILHFLLNLFWKRVKCIPYNRNFMKIVLYTSMLKKYSMYKNTHLSTWKKSDAELVMELRKQGYQIIVLDNNPNYVKVPLSKDVLSSGKIALIVGSENHGVRTEFLDAADMQVFIPTAGDHPLNVSIAHGIAVHTLFGC